MNKIIGIALLLLSALMLLFAYGAVDLVTPGAFGPGEVFVIATFLIALAVGGLGALEMKRPDTAPIYSTLPKSMQWPNMGRVVGIALITLGAILDMFAITAAALVPPTTLSARDGFVIAVAFAGLVTCALGVRELRRVARPKTSVA